MEWEHFDNKVDGKKSNKVKWQQQLSSSKEKGGAAVIPK
jgi:hypothetical protein